MAELLNTPVAQPSYCAATVDIDGVEYGCIEKFGHRGDHQDYSAPPCPGCLGMDQHTEDCPLVNVVTPDGQEVFWTDNGDWRLGARHDRGGPAHWPGMST